MRVWMMTFIALFAFATAAARAGDEAPAGAEQVPAWMEVWKRIQISTLWYLHYGWGEIEEKRENAFSIGRGYVNIKFKAADWLEPRVTFDTTQDDSGDVKVRLKYLYGMFQMPIETAFITEPNVEFGLVHGPWFDFEEHVNAYRAQGTMFVERNNVLNSADLGLTFATLLGQKLPKAYQEKVSTKYPGTWGSLAFGVYNGGGYHAIEKNQNKSFQSRLTLRPLGSIFPNLQISHLFIIGKGNTAEEPDWMLNGFMASFEHESFVLTGQLAFGKGNQMGDKVDQATKESQDCIGASGFAEIKLPWIKSSLLGRYDWWKWDETDSQRIVGGLAFHFIKGSFLMLDIDRVAKSDAPTDWQMKLSLQVAVP